MKEVFKKTLIPNIQAGISLAFLRTSSSNTARRSMKLPTKEAEEAVKLTCVAQLRL